MRKKNPNAMIDDFQAFVDVNLTEWLELQSLVADRRLLLHRLTLDAFLQAAIVWETFKSDWHIACINRDASVYAADAQRRLVSAAANIRISSKFVTLALPKHPSLEVLGQLLDPEGGNLGLGTYSKWRGRADAHLIPKYRLALGSWGLGEVALNDAVTATRDCIVHRSPKAVRALNDALTVGALPASLRRSGNSVRASGLGAYLAARAPGTPSLRRMEVYVTGLHSLAEKLRTP